MQAFMDGCLGSLGRFVAGVVILAIVVLVVFNAC